MRIVEATHYYPFGLMIDSLNYTLSVGIDENPYAYNGKEWQNEGGFNQYDYGARMYDPAVGRWWVVDRYSEKYFSHSPYQYALQNPINNVDIGGDSVWVSTKSRSETIDGVVSQKIEVTIHITGKVLDLSDSPGASADKWASSTNKHLNAQSQSKIINNQDGSVTNITYKIEADFQAASTIDDVSSGDHLIVVVDEVLGKSDPDIPDGGGSAGGLGELNGLISYVQDGFWGEAGPSAGAHEVIHNLGEGHSNVGGNLMSYQPGGSPTLSFDQLRDIAIRTNNGELNKGENSTKAKSNDNRYFWPSSTNEKPYDGSISKGQRIPKPLKNPRE